MLLGIKWSVCTLWLLCSCTPWQLSWPFQKLLQPAIFIDPNLWNMLLVTAQPVVMLHAEEAVHETHLKESWCIFCSGQFCLQVGYRLVSCLVITKLWCHRTMEWQSFLPPHTPLPLALQHLPSPSSGRAHPKSFQLGYLDCWSASSITAACCVPMWIIALISWTFLSVSLPFFPQSI